MMFRPKNTFILITSLLLFTCSCANMLSEENKIDFLRREIRQAVNENFDMERRNNNPHSGKCVGWSGFPTTGDTYASDAIKNVLDVLVTSRYANDLSIEELMKIFMDEAQFLVASLQSDTDYMLISVTICGQGSHHGAFGMYYLVDLSGHVHKIGAGGVMARWSFSDGAAVLMNKKLSSASGTFPMSLYRIYNDGTQWQISELIFDPEPHNVLDKTFDEDGKRFTTQISYGVFNQPCEYTPAFKTQYDFVINWDMTLSYTFDDGLFTLEERKYGDYWTVIDNDPNGRPLKSEMFGTPLGSEWEQFCISGTFLPPMLP